MLQAMKKTEDEDETTNACTHEPHHHINVEMQN
jgi:hypothetical protein